MGSEPAGWRSVDWTGVQWPRGNLQPVQLAYRLSAAGTTGRLAREGSPDPESPANWLGHNNLSYPRDVMGIGVVSQN